jgi:hypothetical protein
MSTENKIAAFRENFSGEYQPKPEPSNENKGAPNVRTNFADAANNKVDQKPEPANNNNADLAARASLVGDSIADKQMTIPVKQQSALGIIGGAFSAQVKELGEGLGMFDAKQPAPAPVPAHQPQVAMNFRPQPGGLF